MQAQVALETTVMTHGLPQPQNLEIVLSMNEAVTRNGATPAAIGILGGKTYVGMTDAQLEQLAQASEPRKVSLRDLPIIGTTGENGGTTVSATLFLAHRAGIPVFSTGGIGGVHRDAPEDVSADLPALANIPGCVVCAGAKSILDLMRTRERLETDGITVLGWQCEKFPAFYCRESAFPVDQRVETAEEVAKVIRERDRLKMTSSILVVAPCPKDSALCPDEVEGLIQSAMHSANTAGIRGKELTPFLLAHLANETDGKSLQANKALLIKNAEIGAKISACLAEQISSPIDR